MSKITHILSFIAKNKAGNDVTKIVAVDDASPAIHLQIGDIVECSGVHEEVSDFMVVNRVVDIDNVPVIHNNNKNKVGSVHRITFTLSLMANLKRSLDKI